MLLLALILCHLACPPIPTDSVQLLFVLQQGLMLSLLSACLLVVVICCRCLSFLVDMPCCCLNVCSGRNMLLILLHVRVVISNLQFTRLQFKCRYKILYICVRDRMSFFCCLPVLTKPVFTYSIFSFIAILNFLAADLRLFVRTSLTHIYLFITIFILTAIQ